MTCRSGLKSTVPFSNINVLLGPRLAKCLRQVYPDLLMVEIRDKIKRNYWEITSPNTNGDPNDNEEFQWYVGMEQFTEC